MDHGNRAHALLSASGASRWMVCTPSPRLEENFDDITSNYAGEGTLAHEFAEVKTRFALKLITKAKKESLETTLRKNEHYTDEMEDEVQKHVDYVLEQYNEAKRKTKDAVILIEEKFDLTAYIEQGFGTSDDTIIGDGILEVIDLKYGKGVRVSAENNSQLKLYGLGALRSHELMYEIHTVRVTIVQPRLDWISTWEIDANELRKWGEEVVIPQAQQAYLGNGEQVPGDHCRFCKVKPKCKALAQMNLEIAKHEFADPYLLDENDLIEIYKKAPQIQTWISSVEAFILDEAIKGKKWPDYKLVEGRSVRAWSDQEKVEATLKEKGYTDIMSDPQPKLLGITAIEKIVGKKDFDNVIGDLVYKTQGKPTLVPESDKRPALGAEQAEVDFRDL